MTKPSAKLELWITGGGTREPLDAVRWLGNVSTGRMALALARHAAGRGHRVTLFLADHVAAPRSKRIRVVRYVTAAQLAAALAAARPRPRVILHAAAVSDYAPRPTSGKMASGKSSWVIELRPLPKIIAKLRSAHPRAVLCMFKLESGISRAELVVRAAAAARKVGAERIFANLLEEVGEEHRGWLVDPDSVSGAVELPTRATAARRIVCDCERLALERRGLR